MLETGADTGSYKLANTSKWPGSGYEFNSEMSYCEKGGTLAWNEDLNTISVNIKILINVLFILIFYLRMCQLV